MLLVILITTYLLSAFVSHDWITYTQLGLFVVAGLLAVRNSPLRRRTARWAVLAAMIGSLLVIVVRVWSASDDARGVAGLWIGTLLLLTVVLLLFEILIMPEVTIQSIYGAISAYLIMGLMFSAFYSAMYYLHGGSFFTQGPAYHSSSDFQYFSFTTLTTLGYGDFTAKLNVGRTVAMIEAMAGQIFLATLVAKLVASFRPATVSARKAAGQAPGADSEPTA